MITIGDKGKEALLIINQKCSLNFTITHTDKNGNAIDHSQSQGFIALQKGKNTYKFEDAVSCQSDKIVVNIPAEETENIAPDEYKWDLIINMQNGERVRLLYGDATVEDTYALD